MLINKIDIKEPLTFKEIRKLSGLSIIQFSELIGVPETTWRRYEKYPSKIQIDKVLRICNILGIDVANIKFL